MNLENNKSENIGRIPYKYNNETIYEWEQNIEDVIIYIKLPPVLLPENKEIVKSNLKLGEKMPKLEIKFSSKRLSVGISGNPPYLNHELFSNIKDSECIWCIEDKEAVITLPKAIKAETWKCAFKGHNQLNDFQVEEVKKKILKERFQEEHSGFDFSDAQINGNVPDPKKFLGGLNYK